MSYGPERIVMGANESKLDAADFIAPLQAGIDLQNSFLYSKPNTGYKRLPPVESRETVQGQVGRVQAWRLVDADDDIYESTTDWNPIGSVNTPTTPTAKRAHSPPTPPATKKRRLVPTAEALKIACEDVVITVESDKNRIEQMEAWPTQEVPPQRHPGSACPPSNNFSLYQDDTESSWLFEDEGYSSHLLSPPCDSKIHMDDEKEEQLVKQLATLHRSNIIVAEPAAGPDGTLSPTHVSGGENNDLDDAREWMLRNQEEAAERSRILRERNLARRELADSSENYMTDTEEHKNQQHPPHDQEHIHQRANHQQGTDKTGKHEQNDNKQSNHQQSNPQQKYPPQQYALPAVESRVDETASPLFCDSEHQDSNMEELLDTTSRDVLENAKSSKAKHENSSKIHRSGAGPDALNSALRDAAEKGLTPNRQLSTQRQPPAGSANVPIKGRELRHNELTNTHNSSQGSNADSARSPKSNNQHSRGDFKSGLPKLGPMATPAVNRAPTAVDTLRKSVNLNRPHSHQKLPGERLSGLDMLSLKRGVNTKPDNDKRRKATAEQPPSSAATLTRAALTSERGPSLTIPLNFDKYKEEEKKVIVEHETAKERKRDLDEIEKVAFYVAQLRCATDPTAMDEKELSEVRKYLARVLKEGKSGKLERVRIQGIRDNMKRRATFFQTPSENDVATCMRELFQASGLDLLKNELQNTVDRISEFGGLRNVYSSKRHNSRPNNHRRRTGESKQVHSSVADKDSGSVTPTRKVKHSQRGTNATDNRRQAQYAHQDRCRKNLAEKLKLYDNIPSQDNQAAPQRDSQTHPLSGDDGALWQPQQDESGNNDSESEEDEGSQFVYGAGWPEPASAAAAFTAPAFFPESTPEAQVDQDIDEINRLEDARQIESGSHASQRSTAQATAPSKPQGFDPELLKRMQKKQVQEPRAAANDSEHLGDAAQADVEAAQATDTDSSDSSGVESEDYDEDDYEGNRQVFKYTVMGAFAGVDIYKDADTYTFKTSYKPESAKAHVGKIIAGVLRKFPPEGGIDGGHWSLDVVYHDGLVEQHLMVGEDVRVEARVWVEKELVDLDKKAYRSAKARRLVKRKFLFAVYWEKIVVPVTHDPEAADTQQQLPVKAQSEPLQEKRDIDLFGEDPLPSSSPGDSAPVVITPPTDEIQYFTTSILANRHAKDLYLAWYHKFLPGFRNEGYRRLEDDATEQQLKELGSWGLWSREESFERAEGKGTTKVEERFKVWVRRIEVSGPRN